MRRQFVSEPFDADMNGIWSDNPVASLPSFSQLHQPVELKSIAVTAMESSDGM